jgi:cysteinyl-tRNA synthetase
MKIQNTLSGELNEVADGNPIGVYVCGVTPYDSAHVGHAMSLMVYDVLIRYLRWSGQEVNFVSNYTDVDDKLIDRAKKLSIDPIELANQNILQWEEEQLRLGLLKPDVRPRVTTELNTIVEMITEIVENGMAYVTESGDVYYSVRKNTDYGKLSRRRVDELKSSDESEDDQKNDGLDFALWKSAKVGEPSWPSPWGEGRPGWHIECSAMARRYLGETFAIHGGGRDLVFPHHENEIAQAESAASKPGVFARVWMHNGMVQRDGEKMSKSVGNVVTVEEALSKWSADAIRFFVLSSHYGSARNITDEAMHASVVGMNRIQRALDLVAIDGPESEILLEKFVGDFISAMNEDLATPQGLAILFDLVKSINTAASSGRNVDDAIAVLEDLTKNVLGFSFNESQNTASNISIAELKSIFDDVGVSQSVDTIENGIDQLLELRNRYREEKQFESADIIRDRLSRLDIALDDTVDGTRWSISTLGRQY